MEWLPSWIFFRVFSFGHFHRPHKNARINPSPILQPAYNTNPCSLILFLYYLPLIPSVAPNIYPSNIFPNNNNPKISSPRHKVHNTLTKAFFFGLETRDLPHLTTIIRQKDDNIPIRRTLFLSPTSPLQNSTKTPSNLFTKLNLNEFTPA